MLFRRRNKESFLLKVRDFFWPRAGWGRSSEYILHRVARLKGSTHGIAAGVATGVAVSFTPFLGLHFLITFACCWLVRGNYIAGAIGTFFGNPWTFPLIFALTGQVGGEIVGAGLGNDVPAWSWADAGADPWTYFMSFLSFLLPYLVGGILVGSVVWVFAYFCVKLLLETYKERKLERRIARGKLRAEAAMAAQDEKERAGG